MKGSVTGGALLVAGCSVGAGMLGLPVVMGLAGFFPSLLFLVLAWLFMTTTGLLLVEISNDFGKEINLLTIVETYFGKAKALCAFLYLFLFYALLVAYIAGSIVLLSPYIPSWSILLFIFLLGFFVYFGTKPVDFANRILMGGLILSYLLMILFGLHKISFGLLKGVHSNYFYFSLPILVTSFGFQNIVPSLCHYMGNDTTRTKRAIWIGSLFTLFVYFLFALLVIGLVPFEDLKRSFFSGVEATVILANYLSPFSAKIANSFALFAILTVASGSGPLSCFLTL